jgi:hypothetical protein
LHNLRNGGSLTSSIGASKENPVKQYGRLF